MDWGIYLVTAQPPKMTAHESIQNSIVYATTAERLGYNHAWVLEHHFTRYGLVGSALLHAAYILGRTDRLKVGTAIQVLPLHHPVKVAEQVALLDQLSNGRLMLGLGRGTFCKDFRVFGVDMSKSREILLEHLEIMIKCWTDGRCSADGKYTQFPAVEVYPPPLTKPYPELYAVATSAESIAWAGKAGIPMIMGFAYSDEQKAVILEEYGAHAEQAGHDPSAIPHVLSCIAGVSRDGETIKKATAEHLVWWMDEGYQASGLYAPGVEPIPSYDLRQREHEARILRGIRTAIDILPEEMAKNPIGSPQECIDKLNTTVEVTGIRRFALGFEAAGDRQAVLESLHMFTEDVIPHVGTGSQSVSNGALADKEIACAVP